MLNFFTYVFQSDLDKSHRDSFNVLSDFFLSLIKSNLIQIDAFLVQIIQTDL